MIDNMSLIMLSISLIQSLLFNKLFVAIVQCKDMEIIGIVQKKVAKKRLSFFLQKVTKNSL